VHGLILAGGDGTRLAADGLTVPKALVDVAGTPQLVRIIEQLADLGCTGITCMLNESAVEWLREDPNGEIGEARRRIERLATIWPCRTPSSLHTFVAGLEHMAPGLVLATMVDSVMAPNDWRRFHDRAASLFDASADAVLAVTRPLDHDDAPLWVSTQAGERVRAIGPEAASAGARVTGGVYAFASRARACAPAVLASGRHRMRNFLADLVASGADVRAVELPRIIDIDHRNDLERANAYMKSFSGAHGRGARR
jgi:NDP-sugar pyrophosphorylase family protein